MRTEAIAFLCAALVCGALVPIITRFARRRGLFDHITSSRKVHAAGIPRLGGVAIVAGFYAPLLALVLYPTGLGRLFYAEPSRAFAFLFGGLAVAALGLFDDIFGAGAVEKFTVQVAVAGYVWCAGFRIETLHLGGGWILPLGVLSAAVTIVWIVGVMNALNLVDGLDGLAGGIALIAATANFLLARGDQPLMGLWMAALSGALISFLRFNFNPASIFMGDGGSLFLGYVLAVSSIRTHQKSSAAVSLLVPIVALALPLTDTALALLRRGVKGRPLFSGDKEHIHHRLLALGLSHRSVVLVLYGASAACGAGSLALGLLAPGLGFGAVLALGLLGLWCLWRLGFFRLETTPDVLEQRKRNLELRKTVKAIADDLARAASVDDVIGSVATLGPAIDAHWVGIRIRGDDGEAARPAWGNTPLPSAPRVQTRIPLAPSLGHLEIGWMDGRAAVDRDHEIAAESVAIFVARALERTAPELFEPAPAAPALAPSGPRREGLSES